MATERTDIRMSPEEIRSFLSRQPRGVVAAVTGARPVATTGTLQLERDLVRVAIPAQDPVAHLLAKDDRVCVIIDQFPTYYEIKGVSVHGHAARQESSEGWLTFTVDLDDVISFDFAKIPVKPTAPAPADQ